MIEKRGQDEIEKLKEVVDKRKKKGRRKKRTKIHRHSRGCSSEEKNRNSGTASETFKERKYREVFNYKMRTLKHFAWRMCCQRIIWSWALSFYINCAFGLHLRLGILAFPFFFMHVCQRHYALFNGSRALFTGPTNTLFRKNGLTVLFTHLKIILLQYFQFLIFNKINSIQMDSNTLYFSLLALLVCPPTKTRDSLVRKKYPRYNNGLKI